MRRQSILADALEASRRSVTHLLPFLRERGFDWQTLLEKRAEATFAQLYLDQATSPALGAAINDAIQLLVAGQASPEDVTSMITDAAAME